MSTTTTPPPTQSDGCMFCVKKFPSDLKAEMKARAAVERKPLRNWLIDRMRQALAPVVTSGKKAAKRG